MTLFNPIPRPIPVTDYNVRRVALPEGINSTNTGDLGVIVSAASFEQMIGILIERDGSGFAWNPDFAEALGEISQFCSYRFKDEFDALDLLCLQEDIGKLLGRADYFFYDDSGSISFAEHPKFPQRVIDEVLGIYNPEIPGMSIFISKLMDISELVINSHE